MRTLDCSDDYTTEKEDGSVRLCAWNPNKKWIEEGIEAVAELRGRVKFITHGICPVHLKQSLEESKKLIKK